MTTSTRGRRGVARLVCVLAIGATAFIAPAAVGPSPPAGAWGTVQWAQCDTQGLSTDFGSSDYAETRNRSGYQCGPWLRWRSWGFYSSWMSGSAYVVTDTEPTGLWGGADHQACYACGIHST